MRAKIRVASDVSRKAETGGGVRCHSVAQWKLLPLAGDKPADAVLMATPSHGGEERSLDQVSSRIKVPLTPRVSVLSAFQIYFVFLPCKARIVPCISRCAGRLAVRRFTVGGTDTTIP